MEERSEEYSEKTADSSRPDTEVIYGEDKTDKKHNPQDSDKAADNFGVAIYKFAYHSGGRGLIISLRKACFRAVAQLLPRITDIQ